jgi:hypothetical protein
MPKCQIKNQLPSNMKAGKNAVPEIQKKIAEWQVLHANLAKSTP